MLSSTQHARPARKFWSKIMALVSLISWRSYLIPRENHSRSPRSELSKPRNIFISASQEVFSPHRRPDDGLPATPDENSPDSISPRCRSPLCWGGERGGSGWVGCWELYTRRRWGDSKTQTMSSSYLARPLSPACIKASWSSSQH
jgi:hypothetical protein